MLIISDMPSILIALWLLILVVFILFLAVRFWQKYTLAQALLAEAEAGQEPVEWVRPEDYRIISLLLIGGGLVLVWAGQALYKKVLMPEQIFVFVFTAVGLLSFFWGGHMAVQKQFAPWFSWLLSAPVRFFGVTPAQVILLFFAVCLSGVARLAAGDALLARQAGIATIAWLLAVLLGILGCYPLYKNGVFRFGKKLNISKWDWWVTAVLFFFALLLRGSALDQIPYSFSGDEGSVGLHALLFLNGEADNLFTGGWFSFPSLYFALVAASIGFLGQTIEAARLISAIGGALAVVGTYYLGRSMFDRATAVFAAVYLAASHYHIHMSRLALNNIWDTLFMAVTLAAFWYGWKNNERLGFVLAGLALGLGQYFYVSFRIVPLLFLFWAFVAWWRKRDLFRQRFPGLVVTALLAFIVVLPLALYFAGHLPEFNAPLNRVTIIGPRLQGMVATTGQSEWIIIGRQMLQAALGYTHEPLKLLYNPGAPLLLSGAAVLFLLGVLWGLLHFDLRYLLLFLPLISVIVTSGLSQEPPASQRFVLTMPIVALFIGIPLGLVFKWLSDLWPKYRILAGGVTAVCIIWVAFLDVHYYFVDVYETYVYGGFNTEVATEIGYYLKEHELQDQKVYFFGFPRMGYFSLSTIPYMAPSMVGEDVVEELNTPPNWSLLRPTIFLFLPERIQELEWVQQSYPDGDFREFKNEKGENLFSVYEVFPSE